MKYDVYFHNDFDGRACAAVMLAFLRSRGDDIERYIAMTYGKEKSWYNTNFLDKGNPAIVVDFTYHPKAAWWFDHHPTTFKKPEWKKYFKSDKRHRLDPKYRSCCGLVYASLKRDFGWKPPKHFEAFVRWADKIDGAGYASAKETIAMNDPGIEMNSYIEALGHTKKEDAHMIRLMASEPLEKVLGDPAIARAVASLRKKVTQSMVFYKKNLTTFRRSMFIDLTHDPLNGLLRFAPHYLHPNIVYSIRMRRKGKLWYLGVGASPWHRTENKFDLAAIMHGYGGGGHKNAGAAEFPTRRAALQAFKEINALVNK